MTTWTRVGATAAASATAATSITAAKPSGVTAGDYLIFSVIGDPSVAAPALIDVVLTGLNTVQVDTGGGTTAVVFAGTAGASEPANYTFEGAGLYSVACVAYRSLDTTVAYSSILTGGDPDTAVHIAQAPNVGCLQVLIAYWSQGTGAPTAGLTATAPTGMTEVIDVVQSTGITTYGHAIFDRESPGGDDLLSAPLAGSPTESESFGIAFGRVPVYSRLLGRFVNADVQGRFIGPVDVQGRYSS